MGKIGLIISREYLTRVRKKSFLVMTVLAPLLIGGFLSLIIWLTLGESNRQKVLVVDELGLIEGEKFTETSSLTFETAAREISKEEFAQSPYDLMVTIKPDVLKSRKVELKFKKYPDAAHELEILRQLNQLLERHLVLQYNLDRSTYDQLKSFSIRSLIKVDIQGEDVSHKRDAAAVGYIFAILIYTFIFLYGVQVMRGVIEEKTSRIVEIIISSVKPFQLMMGKIIGIALVGLTQFVLWVLLTGAILLASKAIFFPDFMDGAVQAANLENKELLQQAIPDYAQSKVYDFIFNKIDFVVILSLFLFYFLGGYLLYSALFAAIGAAVDSESDTQQFMMPITIPLLFGFVVAQIAITNPESEAVFWTSIIPLTSPVVMMVRVAMGFDQGTLWQLYLSMGLLVAGFLICTWMAGRIYRTGILMYGKKTTYKELWKWLFYRG